MKFSQQACVAAVALGAVAEGALYDSPVRIKTGLVQGYQALKNETASDFKDWKTITSWKGIPFAANTTGKNRWRAPQPVEPWKGTFLAKDFGPGCPEASLSLKKRQASTAATSEDCLSVNVWSPATSADECLPVAVWNYPAGGTSDSDLYYGSGMANQGIVFVTYNYRTGPLGWLALPELSHENAVEFGRNSSGNYGLLDQIEVLKWVKENIAAFGGDPDHVTTVGQSFGAGAVIHQVNSPLSKGLIVGAIMESGIKDPYDPEFLAYGSAHVNYTFLYPFSETYAKSLNATTVAELRALSVDVIETGTGVSTFGEGFLAVEDGYAIPYSYLDSLTLGPANDVPILAGNNRDEDGVTYDANYTVAEYEADVKSYYDSTYWADVFLKLYPATTEAKATTAYKAQLRDEARISTWSWARAWSQSAKSPVYTYEWDWSPPDQDQGAYHGSEIPYVLNTLYADDSTPWRKSDYEIANIMSSYWANFIKTGNPNTGGSYDRYDNGTLAHFPAQDTAMNSTFGVGLKFAEELLATPEQIEGFLAWFHNVTTAPE